MPTYTTAQGAGQDGYTINADWIEDSGTLLATSAIPFPAAIGLIFDTAGLVIEAATVKLRLAVGTATPPLARIRAYLVPQVAPANYSLTRLPGSRGGILIAETLYGGSPAGTDISLALGTTFDPANAATVAASWATFQSIVSDPLWSSRLAISVNVQTGSLLQFEAADLPGGTPPRLETTETAPEFASMSHVAKTLRSVLKSKLNSWPDVVAISGLQFYDMPGRAIPSLDAGEVRGYIATHPEEAFDTITPGRNLEVMIVIVAGGTDAEAAADLLDDAQEAVESCVENNAGFGGLVEDMRFASAEPARDGTGERHYGTRAIRYIAPYMVSRR